jgi:hypothetical protein
VHKSVGEDPWGKVYSVKIVSEKLVFGNIEPYFLHCQRLVDEFCFACPTPAPTSTKESLFSLLISSLLDLLDDFVKVLRKPLDATCSVDGVLHGRQKERPNLLQSSLNSVLDRLLTHLVRIQLTSAGAVGTKVQQTLVGGRIPSKPSFSDTGTGGAFGRTGIHIARSVIVGIFPRTAGIKVTVPIVGIFLIDAAAHFALGLFFSVDDCEVAGWHNAAQGLAVFHAVLSALTAVAVTSDVDIFKQRRIALSAEEVIVWLKLSACTLFDLV